MYANSDLKTRKLSEYTIINIVTLGILIVLMAVITAVTPRFLSFANINNILIQVSLVMITGSAVTLLLISGNIDLSVGGVVGQTGVLYAFFCVAGIPTGLSILIATLTGTVIGLINAFLVVKLRLTPVIATLGTMYASRGIAYIFADGSMIGMGLPTDFKKLSTTFVGPVSLVLIFVIITIILFYFIQTKTNLGQYAYFIGSNIKTSILSGVNVGKVITVLFVTVGTLAGFCGVLLAAKLGAGDCKVGEGFEFDTIAAAVIGGTSIAGGKGSVIGMVIGALIIGVLSNALNLMDVASYYQLVIKGIVLVAAIVLQRYIVEKLG